MPLWVVGLLIMAACMAYYVIALAENQENKAVKQIGYLVGVTGLGIVVFSAILRAYYAFDAICRF